MGRSIPPRRLSYQAIVNGEPAHFFWADDDDDAIAKARDVFKGHPGRVTAKRFHALKVICPACKGTGRRGRGKCRRCEGEQYWWDYSACAIATGVLTREQADAQAREEEAGGA